MGVVGKTKLQRYLPYRKIGVRKKSFCFKDNAVSNYDSRGFTQHFFYEGVKIIGRYRRLI